jgi:hypothetical protein
VVKAVLIVGGALTFAMFLVTAISGIDAADSEGRVPMPGEAALELSPGDYGVYYEEQVETGENEIFEPPGGIRMQVRGLAGAPDPELDLGGLGNEIGTDDMTAEEIGTLRIEEEGRYGLVVGPPPRPGEEPAITVGESATDSLLRGLKLAGLVAGVTALLSLAILGVRRLRGKPAPPPTPVTTGPAVAAGPVMAPPAPGPPQAPQPSASADLEGLERLAELRRSGAISQEEFDRLKADLLR